MKAPAAPDQHWLLNSVNQWGLANGSTPSYLTTSTNGSLTLDGLPASAAPFVPPIDGQVCCAGALACDDCGQLLILDTACDRVSRIEPPDRIRPITAFGGKGSHRRQLNSPRGLARRAGAILVADTGNHRVQIFSAAPYALLGVWGRDDARAGSEAGEFNRPWGIAADQCGNAFVADRENHRIQQFSRDGKWMRHLGVGLLGDPTEVATGPGGVLVVVDGANSPAGGLSAGCRWQR